MSARECLAEGTGRLQQGAGTPLPCHPLCSLYARAAQAPRPRPMSHISFLLPPQVRAAEGDSRASDYARDAGPTGRATAAVTHNAEGAVLTSVCGHGRWPWERMPLRCDAVGTPGLIIKPRFLKPSRGICAHWRVPPGHALHPSLPPPPPASPSIPRQEEPARPRDAGPWG